MQPLKPISTSPKDDYFLELTLIHADTACNRGIKASYTGESSTFIFGEGDTSHFQLPNDKKIWEN
jgi:hypothetical protein